MTLHNSILYHFILYHIIVWYIISHYIITYYIISASLASRGVRATSDAERARVRASKACLSRSGSPASDGEGQITSHPFVKFRL